MGKYRYILTHEATELEMRNPSSPQGWESLKLTLKRDKKLHGVFFEFSETKLTFYGEAKDLIKSVFDTEGVNAVIEIDIDYSPYDNGDYTNIISGILNLTEYEEIDNSVAVNIEQKGEEVVFNTRKEHEFNLIGDTSIGGVDLSVGNEGLEWNLTLKSRSIKQTTFIRSETKRYVSPLTAQFLLTTEVVIDEIKGEDSMLDSTFSFLIVDEAPRAGLYNIKVDIEWVAQLLGSSANGVALYKNESFYENIINNTDDLTGSKIYETTVTLAVGEKFGIGIFLEGADNEITLTKCDTEYKAVTTFPDKDVGAITLGEAFRNMTERILDNKATFKSDLLGFPNGVRDDDGYYPDEFYEGDADTTLIKYYKFLVLNGFYIRGFPSTTEIELTSEDSKPFIARFDKFFQSANSIIPLGAGFDSDGSFRVDGRDYFYNSEVVYDLGVVDKLSISPDLDNTKSNIKIGYKKFENNEDSDNALLGIHGQSEWNTPIDRYEGKFNAVSDFIADMYSIELTRRQEYSEQSKKGWKYDKQPFIIHAFRQNLSTWQNFRDQQIESSTDLEDPLTVYNVAISTQRNARRFQKWYTGALRPYYDDEVCNFLSGEPNTLPAYDLDETAPVLPESEEIKESDSIDIDEIQTVFNGLLYTIEKVATLDNWIDLKVNARNKIGFSYSGIERSGYISDVNYEPEKSLLRITLIGANT